MNVVLFGSKGILGSAIKEALEDKGFLVYAYSSNTCDITNTKQLEAVFNDKRDLNFIINCAAYTKVDDAELECDKAEQLNAVAVKNLAKYSKKLSATFIHFSTDYVFDGKSEISYKEEDSCNPINFYGKTKLNGETNCIKSCDDYYIFRVQWLYGQTGNHFVATMKKLFKQRKEIQVVNDQFGSPTFTNTLSKYVLSVMQKRPQPGVYHCTDKGITTWYDFCKTIAKYEGFEGQIIPVSSNEFKRPAERPLNGVLNCDKFDNAVDCERQHWKKSLELYYNHVYKEQKV